MASDAFAWVLFLLCFPHRKGFHTQRFGCSGLVFVVIGFCHRLRATSGLPDLADSLRYMCSVQRQDAETLETAANVQISIVRLSNLTKGNSPWRLKTYWDPCDRTVMPCMEISLVFPKYVRQTSLDRHKLATDASLGILSDLSPIT